VTGFDPLASPTGRTRAFYNRISHAYDLLADASEHAARDVGLDALDVSPGERVLEIGCGTGHALVRLAGAAGQAGTVCGIDVSDGMIAVARRCLREARLAARVHTLVGDARCLPLRAGAFDAAFMSFTLELFEPRDRSGVLREIGRVLRPGGRLGVVAMAGIHHPGPAVEVYQWLHRHFPHIIDCQPIDLAAVLHEAGYALERSRTMPIWGLPVEAGVARLPVS
jgi:demethylmenaquinone methyltransferase/2-methoxy-6-polyprenyl-1,4-benzoquinol methylase